MNELLPSLGDVVLYHDPRTALVCPAIVTRVRPGSGHPPRLDLTVFQVDGPDPTYNVPGHPGEFGHWSFRPET